jgi:DNA polymerase-3 subunit delta'
MTPGHGLDILEPHASTDQKAPFWRQPIVERTLRQAAAREHLAHAYLLAGPEGVGKWAAALWIARCLLCREPGPEGKPCGLCRDCHRVDSGAHSDWHVLFPVPSSSAEKDREALLAAKSADPYTVHHFEKRPYVAIDRVRALIGELSRTAVEGGAKVVLIADAERMAGDCQAILLKSIEEPSPGASFILTSADYGRLLPTVVSRCQVIRFAPVDTSAIAQRLVSERGVAPETADIIAELSGGGWGNAVRLADEQSETRREANTALWRKMFDGTTGELTSQIEAVFRPGRKAIGLGPALEAFDLWSLLLRRECRRAAGTPQSEGDTGSDTPLSNPEVAWACWQILQHGRATLFVNVAERTAITGTFLALRRRLGCD